MPCLPYGLGCWTLVPGWGPVYQRREFRLMRTLSTRFICFPERFRRECFSEG